MIATEHYEVVLVQHISTFWNSLYNMQIYIYMHVDRYDTYKHDRGTKNMNMSVFNFQIMKVHVGSCKAKKAIIRVNTLKT